MAKPKDNCLQGYSGLEQAHGEKMARDPALVE
jgi:hypothetical protein